MIALACDHGALDLKKAIMAHLDKRGLAYKDFGCYTCLLYTSDAADD